MIRYIVAVAALGVAFCAPTLAQEPRNMAPGDPVRHYALGDHEPPPVEVGVATLKALVASAEKAGEKTVFIGGPVWSTDKSVQPKPGTYLLDNNAVVSVR